MRSVKAFAPATVANVCCGFDVLGFAVDSPGDEALVRLTSESGVTINKIVGDGGRLPREADRNTAGVAVLSYLKAIGSDQGVEIELHKNLPLGSGMGSSAASGVAALLAINHLLGEPLSREELIPFAMEAERVACGSGHADNVAPSMLGGFVLIREYKPLDIIKIPTKAELYCAMVHPHIELKTSDSRKVLKPSVALTDAVIQNGNMGGLVIGLMTPDYNLIGRSLKDVIAEPVRSAFIPGFEIIKHEMIRTGALGCGISGSGPTLFALSSDRQKAVEAGAAAQSRFLNYQLKSDVYVSKINFEGARLVS